MRYALRPLGIESNSTNAISDPERSNCGGRIVANIGTDEAKAAGNAPGNCLVVSGCDRGRLSFTPLGIHFHD